MIEIVCFYNLCVFESKAFEHAQACGDGKNVVLPEVVGFNQSLLREVFIAGGQFTILIGFGQYGSLAEKVQGIKKRGCPRRTF